MEADPDPSKKKVQPSDGADNTFAVPKGGVRPEGGLVVAGVANKREGKFFFKATWSADSSRKRVHGELRARWNKCVPEDTASWSCGRSCSA